MKNNSLYYSVGPLLYTPANRQDIALAVTSGKFGRGYSLALCLEDTINDNFVEEAIQIMIANIQELYRQSLEKDFYLPKIFIRVRSAAQIQRLTKELAHAMQIVSGYIIPKFSTNNADEYISAVLAANELAGKPVYFMPIYESHSIIVLRHRTDILYSLKDKLDNVNELVMNIRVGGNDLCNAFGFRRHVDESIHKIRPVSDIFADIITIYGMDYVISGPVFEYYSGDGWDTGLINEIKDDRQCGFIGKTVIHPNQIAIVNEAYKVMQSDFADAQAIVNWDPDSSSLVSGNTGKIRMNEYKTHINWARQIIYLADNFGIK